MNWPAPIPKRVLRRPEHAAELDLIIGGALTEIERVLEETRFDHEDRIEALAQIRDAAVSAIAELTCVPIERNGTGPFTAVF